jgi:hypothetical protein
MKTLEFIAKKYHLDLKASSPIEILNMGRNNLPELFAELGFKVGLEMGAEAGRYAEVLCKGNPEGKLYCVDAWKAYPGYREHVSQSQLDEIYESAKKRLSLLTANSSRLSVSMLLKILPMARLIMSISTATTNMVLPSKT